MELYSTNNKKLRVSFKEAVFNSLPSDKGLYLPVQIPQIDPEFLSNIENFSFPEIAYTVARTLLGDDIPDNELKFLIYDAINFDAPIVTLDDQTHVLELFHGPSLAFKDFGARFMSRVMAHYLAPADGLLDVLVATSGDTGGAVALGFLGVPNTRVTILFPKGKVSEIQRLQLTTNGQNIRAIAIDGTFDDCQSLVKQAFTDEELHSKFNLTSANSINIARLIPQSFYYFYAYAQLKRLGRSNIVFAVPSGNFGNIGAGILAYRMGLPVKHFVAATNANDTVPRFLLSGVYETMHSIQTFSNAMDVGAPSNWVRIMDLFNGNLEAVKKMITGFSFSDEETLAGIEELYHRYAYVACPHTAISYLATQAFAKQDPHHLDTRVFLSTAHACKFPNFLSAIEEGKEPIPEQVKVLQQKKEKFLSLSKNYSDFKHYLISASEIED